MGGCPSCAAPERERIVVAPGACGRVVCVCRECGEQSPEQGSVVFPLLTRYDGDVRITRVSFPWFTAPAEA